MLHFSPINHPFVNSCNNLSYADATFTLALTKEMVSLSILIRSEIARASPMALAYETFPYLLVLIGLMPTFGVSDPGESVEKLKLFHKLLFCSFFVDVHKLEKEAVDLEEFMGCVMNVDDG